MAGLSKAIIFSIISQCNSGVDPVTTDTVINVESAGNPYAIALVNSKEKISQPKTEEEAIKLANYLESKNIDFSAGLMQINKRNFKNLSLTNDTVFNACKNVQAGTTILKNCYAKAVKENGNKKDEQELLRDAMSCYYSGNLQRGYKKEGKYSYVDLINNKISTGDTEITVPRIKKIDEQNSQEKTRASWDVFNDF